MVMMKRMGWVLALLLAAGTVQAKVVITGTRVIYPGQEREVLVRLSNMAEDVPSVLQVWLDSGDEKSTPDTVDVPFVISPPVFRMDPGSSQTLRVSYTGEPLADDRETLFWLNVLEIPPALDKMAEGEVNLQFSFRTRLKTFFRPEGLKPLAHEAPQQLQWSVQPAKNQQGYVVQVSNPTPYFITLQGLKVVDGEKQLRYKRGNHVNEGMVAPFGRQQFNVPGLDARPGAAAKIEFQTVNDFGGRVGSVAAFTAAATD